MRDSMGEIRWARFEGRFAWRDSKGEPRNVARIPRTQYPGRSVVCPAKATAQQRSNPRSRRNPSHRARPQATAFRLLPLLSRFRFRSFSSSPAAPAAPYCGTVPPNATTSSSSSLAACHPANHHQHRPSTSSAAPPLPEPSLASCHCSSSSSSSTSTSTTSSRSSSTVRSTLSVGLSRAACARLRARLGAPGHVRGTLELHTGEE